MKKSDVNKEIDALLNKKAIKKEIKQSVQSSIQKEVEELPEIANEKNNNILSPDEILNIKSKESIKKDTKELTGVDEDLKDEIIKTEAQKTDLTNTSELLLNEKWRKRKTILRERSIPALTTLDTIADFYDVKWLREWVDSFTEYITSVGGRGRQDIVDIAKYSIDKETSARQELLNALGKR